MTPSTPAPAETSLPAQRALVLGSTSRYRQELLQRLRIPFAVAAPDVDETPQPGEAPAAAAASMVGGGGRSGIPEGGRETAKLKANATIAARSSAGPRQSPPGLTALPSHPPRLPPLPPDHGNSLFQPTAQRLGGPSAQPQAA